MHQPPENCHGRCIRPFLTDSRESHDFRAASEGKENSSYIHSFLHLFIILHVFYSNLEHAGLHHTYIAGSDEDNTAVQAPWSGGEGRGIEGGSALGRDF